MCLKEPGELSWYSDSATARTTEVSFGCQRVQDLHESIHTAYRTHPASYLLCSEPSFTSGKADQAWMWLSPSTVEFKPECSYVTTHPNAWVACIWLMTLFRIAFLTDESHHIWSVFDSLIVYTPVTYNYVIPLRFCVTLIPQPLQRLRVMGTSSWAKPCCTDFLCKE